MSAWKVILATLAIFVAGLVTGAVGVRYLTKDRNLFLPRNAMMPAPLRSEYLAFLDRELQLAPDQFRGISNAVHQSQERVAIMYDLIAPDVREELRLTREEIKAQLNREQRQKFDTLPRRAPRPAGERVRPAGDGT